MFCSCNTVLGVEEGPKTPGRLFDAVAPRLCKGAALPPLSIIRREFAACLAIVATCTAAIPDAAVVEGEDVAASGMTGSGVVVPAPAFAPKLMLPRASFCC